MKVESQWIFKDILLKVSYVLAIPQGLSYSVNFQLPNEWSKSCKITYYDLAMQEMLFQNYLIMAKIWWLFAQPYKDFHY